MSPAPSRSPLTPGLTGIFIIPPLALLLVLLWHTWPDPDIWYHLTLGRGVVEHHSFQPPDNLILHQESYTNLYWLFQLAVWGAFRIAGVTGVTFLFLAVWCLAFACWGACARLRAYSLLPVGVAAVLTCFPRFMERPEVFSYLFLAGFLLRLSRSGEAGALRSRELVLWFAAQAAWTNVHGYFFLGPAVAAAWAAAGSLQSRIGAGRVVDAGRRWVLPGVLLAATLVSPFGTGSWRAVLGLSGYLGAMRMAIKEFQPYAVGASPGLRELIFWAWALGVAAIALDLLLSKRRLFEPALAGLGIALAVYTSRNAPLAVFLSAPAWGAWLSSRGAPLPAGAFARRAATALSAALAVGAIVFCAKVIRSGSYYPLPTSSRFGTAVSNRTLPVGALRYLRDTQFAGTLFNHPSDGGYLEFHLPALRLYADSRFSDVDKTLEYFRALVVPQRFQELDRRQRFDAVLVNVKEGQDPLLPALTAANGWELVYADLYRGLFVNRGSATAQNLPRGPFALYDGEDLADGLNVECAVRWLGILERLRRPDLVVLALRQLAQAPRVPSEIPQTARFVGLGLNSREIQDLAAELATRPL